MLTVAKTVAGWKHPNNFKNATEPYKSLVGDGVTVDLVDLCEAFVFLQGERIESDYNTTSVFDELRALTAVERAEDAINRWSRIKSTNEGKAFMMLVFMNGRERKQGTTQ